MSDTKEKVMNWIKHECLNHYGWREDYALEVLVGIIAGAIGILGLRAYRR